MNIELVEGWDSETAKAMLDQDEDHPFGKGLFGSPFEHQEMVIFRVDGTPVGYAILDVMGSCIISRFFIVPRYRRLGLGLKLARSLFDMLRDYGFQSVEMTVTSHNAGLFWRSVMTGLDYQERHDGSGFWVRLRH